MAMQVRMLSGKRREVDTKFYIAAGGGAARERMRRVRSPGRMGELKDPPIGRVVEVWPKGGNSLVLETTDMAYLQSVVHLLSGVSFSHRVGAGLSNAKAGETLSEIAKTMFPFLVFLDVSYQEGQTTSDQIVEEAKEVSGIIRGELNRMGVEMTGGDTNVVFTLPATRVGLDAAYGISRNRLLGCLALDVNEHAPSFIGVLQQTGVDFVQLGLLTYREERRQRNTDQDALIAFSEQPWRVLARPAHPRHLYEPTDLDMHRKRLKVMGHPDALVLDAKGMAYVQQLAPGAPKEFAGKWDWS